MLKALMFQLLESTSLSKIRFQMSNLHPYTEGYKVDHHPDFLSRKQFTRHRDVTRDDFLAVEPRSQSQSTTATTTEAQSLKHAADSEAAAAVDDSSDGEAHAMNQAPPAPEVGRGRCQL